MNDNVFSTIKKYHPDQKSFPHQKKNNYMNNRQHIMVFVNLRYKKVRLRI